MKRLSWCLIEVLTVLLQLFFVSRSIAAAEPLPIGPVETTGPWGRAPEVDWIEPVPVVHAIAPQEAGRQRELPADWGRPLLREREAVLPNPINGWELVDRALAQGLPAPLLAAGMATAAIPRRSFHRERVAPNFVLPVSSGV